MGNSLSFFPNPNKTGIRIKVIGVDNNSPNTSEIAAGLRYCAVSEVSISRGNNPHTVVVVVRKIACILLLPASSNA